MERKGYCNMITAFATHTTSHFSAQRKKEQGVERRGAGLDLGKHFRTKRQKTTKTMKKINKHSKST